MLLLLRGAECSRAMLTAAFHVIFGSVVSEHVLLRKPPWLDLVLPQNLKADWEKPRKSSVRTAGIAVEMRNWHHLNTSLGLRKPAQYL
jgi:microcompartment protein CcmL/EutN